MAKTAKGERDGRVPACVLDLAVERLGEVALAQHTDSSHTGSHRRLCGGASEHASERRATNETPGSRAMPYRGGVSGDRGWLRRGRSQVAIERGEGVKKKRKKKKRARVFQVQRRCEAGMD